MAPVGVQGRASTSGMTGGGPSKRLKITNDAVE
jgi:hypothetical protein